MKDEKERMQEYLNCYTNAHGDLPRAKEVDKAIHKITISLRTFIIIVAIIVFLMLIIIGGAIYKSTYVIFSMNKKDFIKEIEKTYGQKLEIAEDYSTKKGNGLIIFKTKKEPKVQFTANKTYNYYQLDYEANALIYYSQNSTDSILKDIEIIQEKKPINRSNKERLECKIYVPVDNYQQIEDGINKIYELQAWMEKKIKKFSIPIDLKIGDYVSHIGYERYSDGNKRNKEERINREKYVYYWYIKDKGGTIENISEEDLLLVDRPQTLDVYINGKKAIDGGRSQGSGDNQKIFYLQATYKMETQNYTVDTPYVILNCDKFNILDENTNQEFSFQYKEKTYKVQWSQHVHGNNLSSETTLSDLEKVLGIKIEYDYTNKKANLIID